MERHKTEEAEDEQGRRHHTSWVSYDLPPAIQHRHREKVDSNSGKPKSTQATRCMQTTRQERHERTGELLFGDQPGLPQVVDCYLVLGVLHDGDTSPDDQFADAVQRLARLRVDVSKRVRSSGQGE